MSWVRLPARTVAGLASIVKSDPSWAVPERLKGTMTSVALVMSSSIVTASVPSASTAVWLAAWNSTTGREPD